MRPAAHHRREIAGSHASRHRGAGKHRCPTPSACRNCSMPSATTTRNRVMPPTMRNFRNGSFTAARTTINTPRGARWRRMIISPASFSGRALIISARRMRGRTAPAGRACSTFAVSKNRHRLVPAKPLERPADGLSLRPPATPLNRRFNGVESWNWPSNSTVTVRCFANCPEVTLTLNDKIIGTKKRSEAVNGVLNWQVPFEPGTLKAVGRANGQDVCDYVLKTAGAPQPD
jgi:hypothetical protein